jgi:hypothetical protein
MLDHNAINETSFTKIRLHLTRTFFNSQSRGIKSEQIFFSRPPSRRRNYQFISDLAQKMHHVKYSVIQAAQF